MYHKKTMNHYVYKITNLKNGSIYIGVRTSPNPETDDYMGSSKIMNILYKIEGLGNFKKEIIKIFKTRLEAEKFESSLLTEEFCNDPKTYNIQNTGDFTGNKHGFRKDLWYDYYHTIREEYSSGKNTKELSKKYSCDSGTISHIINDIKRTNSESQIIRFNNNPSSGVRNKKLDESISDIIELYNKGKSILEISKKYNVNASAIKLRLSQSGIKIRSHKESQSLRDKSKRWRKSIWDKQEEIVLLYNECKNMNKISKIYNVDIGTIKSILKSNGINDTSKKKK